MSEADYPVLVGFGQTTQRSDDPETALEPAALMAEAARRAAEDCGAPDLLAEVDSIRVVNLVSWSYGDAPGVLGRLLGITPRERVYTTVGGNTPQLLVNLTADELVAGSARVVLIAGGECMYSQRRARSARVRLAWTPPSGEPDRVVGDDRWGTQDLEQRHGAAVPIQIYPLFENALRAAHGWSLDEHRRRLGTQCARFSEIAAENPDAWFRTRRSAEELATVTAENRMICFPYPKLMNSVLDVDQAAAVLMTTAAEARRLGVPEDRWVHLVGGADAHDHWFLMDRVDYRSSPAIRRAGRAALEQARTSIDEIGFLDLYSCFPCAPRIARDMLGMREDDPRDLTTTGSLLYFGGPGSNHPLHAMVTMAPKLRASPRAKGLITGLGWYVTKHSVGVYSGTPPEVPWRRHDADAIQADVDREPRPPLAALPSGPATVETYTIAHARDGSPERGIVIGRLEDGRRFIANTPTDASLLEDLERREVVGMRGTVAGTGSEGTNVWQPG